MRRVRWLTAALVAVVVVLVGAAPAQAETVRQAQWHLDALQVPAAHQVTRGGGVIVAVIDSVGVDVSHPDLAGQVLPGAGFGTNASPNGWSSAAGASHATAMAGVIAAKGGGPNNALGIAPGAQILPVAAGDNETRTSVDVAAAIRWAVDHKAKVINLSLGGFGTFPDEIEAVRYALSHNVVVVAAVGNVDTGGPEVSSPASIPGVVAVSGTTRDASFWSNSASGPQVAIAAPAVGIISTSVRSADPSGYLSGDGTSDSTAIVSGVVALIRAKFPQLNAANVINRLLATAKDQGDPGRDVLFGYGSLRVVDALTKPVPEVAANPLGTPPGAASESSRSSRGASDDEEQLIPGGVLVGIVVVLGLIATLIIITLVMASRRKRPVGPSPVGHGLAVPPQPHPPPHPALGPSGSPGRPRGP